MPYEPHKALPEPENADTTLWRYMSFAKFMSLLEGQETLFFPRLPNLDDEHEGRIAEGTIQQFRKRKEMAESDEEREKIEQNMRRIIGLQERFRELLYVCSWNQNKVESLTMWRSYLDNAEGVAIKTTFERLTEAFAAADEEVHVGKVQYVNVEDFEGDWTNALNHARIKRLAFRDEREVRAVVVQEEITDPGIHVRVDLSTLVQSIVVAPDAGEWMQDLVEAAVVKHGIDVGKIAPSKITRPHLSSGSL